jgi:F420-non-reducing hydrogenase iron-sulfur subunit
MMKSLMEYIGIEPERYQTAWISGAEGPKFQETMTRFVQGVKNLGPNRKLRDAR